jgi:uncharacterized protein
MPPLRVVAGGKLPRRGSLCKSPPRRLPARPRGEVRGKPGDERYVNDLRRHWTIRRGGRLMMFGRLGQSLAAAVLFGAALAGAAGHPAAADPHFLWKVSSGTATVYLLGTIHVGKAELYPLPAVIEESFKEADTLIEEIDLNGGGQMQRLSQSVLKDGTYPSGDSVTNHISEETQTRLAAYAKTSALGATYQHLKPWLLGLLIDAIEIKHLGLDGGKGLDTHFAQEAAQLHKPIGGLETADFQLQLVMSFPDDLQDKLLLATLLEADKGRETMERMMQAWSAGSPQAMEAVITAELRDYPALQPVMEKVLYQRNDAMTQKIVDFLQTQKVYFVAIGAGHLVGDRGILRQLRDKHYTIEQL